MLSRIYSSGWGRGALAATAGATMLLTAAAPASASSLSAGQVSAVVSLLQAFHVDATTIANVSAQLGGTASSTGTSASSTGSVGGIFIGLLHQGDNGKGVCFLHAVLAADPAVSSSITAGDVGDNCSFGPLTTKELKKFQGKHGLAPVGFIGPKTLEALQRELAKNNLSTENEDNNASSTGRGGEHGRICAKVPPGHLIAPGWLRKNGDKPVVPECQTLPPGIQHKIGDDHHGTTTPPVADTTAPSISNISATSVATTSATISWSTNENATSKVYYQSGSTINLGSALSVNAGTLVMSHTSNLSGLSASTMYQYVVSSTDGSGNVATSSAHSFTTTN